MSAINLKAAR